MTKERISLKVFLNRDIDEWKPTEDEVSVALTSMASNSIHTVKRTELDNWKSFNIDEEIPDEEQSTTNARWIVSEKPSDGKKSSKQDL